MVWYKPRTWFKNTPTEPTEPTTNTNTWTTVPLTWGNLTWGNLTWGNLTWNLLSWNSVSWNVSSPTWNIFTSLNQGNNTLVNKNNNTAVLKPLEEWMEIDNPYKKTTRDKIKWIFSRHDEPTTFWWETTIDKALEARWEADENKKREKILEWFSLDPYSTEWTWASFWDPIKLTIQTTEWWWKKTWSQALSEARWRNLTNIWNWWEDAWALWVLWNAMENYRPTLWSMNVESSVSNKYWWELKASYVNNSVNQENVDWLPEWWSLVYEWPNKEEIKYDIGATIPVLYSEAMNWTKTQEELSMAIDDMYNKYKDNFAFVYDWKSDYPKVKKPELTKEHLIWFINNEWKKSWYRQELTEKKWLQNEQDSSAYVITQALEKAYKKIWPNVELSSIATVQWREEFMNDAKASVIDFVWRLYQRLHPTLRVKEEIQRQLWVEDLDEIALEDIPEKYREDVRYIRDTERMFNMFVDNHIDYLASLPSYTDKTTWKIDRIPDTIVDSEWNAHSYSTKIFDWIPISKDDRFWWWNMWITDVALSPIDIIQKRWMNASLDWSNKTDWFWWNLWEKSQYWWSNVIWSTVSEFLWQQAIGRWENLIHNIFASDSWDIPFEFVDMDSSITAAMTTNDSNFGRLMQSYWIKTEEYSPELLANIIEAVLADKWATKLWEMWQVRLLAQLDKIPYFKNTVRWQQFAQWLAYTIRGLQRLWTDQVLIDAPLAIWDTEFWSDTSRTFSVYWTLFGEWIWMLSDLRALTRSVVLNFMKPSKFDETIDPIRLIVNNEWILDDVAASMWRYSKDESWKIVWDQYKLLIQDLSSYSKYMKDLSDIVTKSVKDFLTEWGTIDVANDVIKKWAYNVFKQVYAQNSAMSKVITDLITDSRANIADIVKYIWWFDKTVKIWPFISTIKVDDWAWNMIEKVVQKYDEKMDMLIDWWLVAWINRWLTKAEVEALVREWFIPKPEVLWDWDMIKYPEEYFVPHKYSYIENIDKNTSKIKEWTRYYLTEKWLQKLWVGVRAINDPLAIAIMSEDSKALIDKIKSLKEWTQRRITDADLDTIWEVDWIRRLAENIANLDYLDICK